MGPISGYASKSAKLETAGFKGMFGIIGVVGKFVWLDKLEVCHVAAQKHLGVVDEITIKSWHTNTKKWRLMLLVVGKRT